MYRIVSSPPEGPEKVEVDKLENMVEARFFLEVKKDMVSGTAQILDINEMSFSIKPLDGSENRTYIIKKYNIFNKY